METTELSNKVIEFIKRRFKDDRNWISGNCYYFAIILKDRFQGEIYYDVVLGHFVTRIGEHFYDWTGIYVPDNEDDVVNWENFDEYDALQKQHIVRDCLL